MGHMTACLRKEVFLMETMQTHGVAGAPDSTANAPMGSTPRCRYCRELAGVTVCWAASSVTIVTDGDCARCPVPAMLERVDCYYLQARADLGHRSVSWICGATGRPVNESAPSDCPACEACERERTRRQAVD